MPPASTSIPSSNLNTPFSPRSTPAARDRELFWILLAISLILFLETFLAIAWIRRHNLASKARWKRLRERGVVIVSGPAIAWVGDLPLQQQVSYINLRRTAEASRYNITRENDRTLA
ncbi:hypothetical protein EK21DRAFT_106841 [Setomelanomma holmii]|uniref:Uncharacterized protein n=1 Tax=Setomelanomma holmii TaxID=210430 RepID=A0A9P4HK28_9PLEO|nr:hypothetical protein EK21DRAFT_106841 [Setomelanomma holmii]